MWSIVLSSAESQPKCVYLSYALPSAVLVKPESVALKTDYSELKSPATTAGRALAETVSFIAAISAALVLSSVESP